MMHTSKDEELNALRKKIIRYQLLTVPGSIFLGLALYGIFAANGDAFYPALNNPAVVYGLLVAGIIIEIWQFIKVVPLLKRQIELKSK